MTAPRSGAKRVHHAGGTIINPMDHGDRLNFLFPEDAEGWYSLLLYSCILINNIYFYV